MSSDAYPTYTAAEDRGRQQGGRSPSLSSNASVRLVKLARPRPSSGRHGPWWAKGRPSKSTIVTGGAWTYLYAFARPKTGEVHWLILPRVNTKVFSLALESFAKEVGAGDEKAHLARPRSSRMAHHRQAARPRGHTFRVPAREFARRRTGSQAGHTGGSY